MAQNNVVYNLVGNDSSTSIDITNSGSANNSNPKKSATTFEKALPRPEPQPFSIPALRRIGSRKSEGGPYLWKPYTIRAPFLCLIIILTALLIVAIELIIQKQNRDGAVTFAENGGELSKWQIFVSQYAATIIAVLYSILVSVVDLDVKRLEPYFQLSNPNGALAKDSICLKYPVEFLASVPISALKRRHWSVFCAGLATVFTFWALTPLQSSFLTNGTVKKITSQPGRVVSGLQKAEPTTPVFLFNTYAQSWLGSENTEYTTKDYAMLPFNVSGSTSNNEKDIWEGTTTVHYADVDCAAAEKMYWHQNGRNSFISRTNISDNFVWVAPQRNCTSTQISGLPGTGELFRTFEGLWVQYSKETQNSYYLESTNDCKLSAEEANIFLFGFMKYSKTEETQLTMTYCTSRYMSQKAQVLVAARSPHSVQNIKLLGEPRRLDYKEFNSTFFEKIINGYGGDLTLDRGPFHAAPEDVSHTAEIRNKMVRFGDSPALANVVSEQRDVEQLLNREKQVEAIRKAYKRLYANYVITHLLSNTTLPLEITQTTSLNAVIAVPYMGRILEGVLGAVFLLLSAMFYIEQKRELKLFSDPASITHTMSLVSESHDLLDDFESLDRATSEEIDETLANISYRLGGWKDGKYRLDKAGGSHASPYQPKRNLGDETLVHGTELHQLVGVSFLCCVIGIIVLLIVLFWSNIKNQGLPTTSDDTFVVQIIFSFIPTVIATALEPFWVLLCRRFAMIQPFFNLKNRHSQPGDSISLKFTSIPPTLVLPSALRTKHYFLGAVALMCLIANILAVSLGGLFNPSDGYTVREITHSHNISQAISSIPQVVQDYNSIDFTKNSEDGITSIGSGDHNFIAWANITNRTPLPPWTTTKFFFLPVMPKAVVQNGSLLQGRTIGFGVQADCKQVDNPTISIGNGEFNFNYSLYDSTSSQYCIASTTVSNTCSDCKPSGSIALSEGGPGQGQHVSVEKYVQVNSTNPKDDTNSCLRYFIGTWSHTIWKDKLFASAGEMKTVACSTKLVTGNFDVTVDQNLRVIDYTVRGKLQVNDKTRVENGIRPTDLLAAYTTVLDRDSAPGVHQFVTAREWNSQWMNYHLNSTALINPNATLPSSGELSNAMKLTYESLFPALLSINYQRLFKPSAVRETKGKMLILSKRMEMSPVMFIISVGILGMYLLVGSYIYLFRCKPFLPRYPNSLASIMAFLYGSKALEDVIGTEFLTTRQRNAILENTKHTYGYGVSQGRNGAIRVGIEKEPLLGFANMNRNTRITRGKWWKFW